MVINDILSLWWLDEIISVWWLYVPFVILLLLALWELLRERESANEERIRRLEEEVEKLKKEKDQV